MKIKIFLTSLITGIIVVTSFGGYESASAECLDKADMTFLEFMNVDSDISYTRKPLFNENLIQSGWQYNFNLDDTYGYALIADTYEFGEQSYEIEEVYYEQLSPFDNCSGIPVYITFNLYIDYKDNSYIDVITGAKLSEDAVKKAVEKGFGYSGSGATTDISETISYSNKTEDSYSIMSDLPKYSAAEVGTNCANVAGSIVIGYYDRFCENLIPNYQTYRVFGNKVVYKIMSAEAAEVIASLKELMGTDKNQLGTTFTGFQNGMAEYASSHGYTYNTESVLTGGNFDFDKYKKSVEDNKPVTLFLNNYAILDYVEENGGQDIIKSLHSTVTHVVVGCGYMQHNYYNSYGQKIADRTYLKIASGFTPREICYLNINSVSKIDKAISVTIS